MTAPAIGMETIPMATGSVAIGMLLVRLGWSRRRMLSIGGWLLAAGALLALGWRDGAWGLAIGTVAGIATALACIAHAGCVTPYRPQRPVREAPAVVLPYDRGALARRVAVFALTVPGGFAAAEWLAFGAQALARARGAGAADAYVLALVLQPVAWALIMCVQMIQASAPRMIPPPVLAACIGTLLWAAA